MRWLKKEARGGEVIFWVGTVLVLHILHFFIGMSVLESYGVTVPPVRGSEAVTGLSYLFSHAPDTLLEEVVFRLPLALLAWAEWSLIGILGYAIFASAMFGVIHGSAYHILFQGVGGFMYSLLFMKCGGLQGRWKKALACSFAAHFLYNAVIIVLLTT